MSFKPIKTESKRSDISILQLNSKLLTYLTVRIAER